MKRFALFALVALVAINAAAPPAEHRTPFDPKRDPDKDLQVAVAQARQEHKRILLDIGGEWCVWCHILDKTLEGDRTLTDLLAAHYVVVKVNFSEENKNSAFLSHFPKIEGYPHLFVLDQDGKLLHSQNTDLLESGKGYNLKAVQDFLEHWAV
jgi:thiol:disulfide interchange protein